MSQRRRLPNSLRWRAVGWMEMGLSQADAARRLNVSRSVVQRLWDQYQSEDSVSEDLFQADHELQHLQRRPFSSSFGTKEKNHYCAAARCRPLSSIRKKNLRYYGAKSSSQCRSVCKKTSCVRSPQRTTAKEPLMLGKRTCFLDAATMGFCAVHRRVRFTMESDSGRLLIWREQRTRYHQSTLLKDTVIEVVESWFGQGSRSVATLTCMCSMEEP
ncbi:uncharacterized protein TNCV_1113761 [Trichonephila clavipes]|nr:uncharacterized protein TNCV_1113761 [Trichonephila clavipes]